MLMLMLIDVFEGPRLGQDWFNSDFIHVGKNLVQKEKMKEHVACGEECFLISDHVIRQ